MEPSYLYLPPVHRFAIGFRPIEGDVSNSFYLDKEKLVNKGDGKCSIVTIFKNVFQYNCGFAI